MLKKYPPIPKGKKLVFRPWITIKGKKVYASSFGKKAFPILVEA